MDLSPLLISMKVAVFGHVLYVFSGPVRGVEGRARKALQRRGGRSVYAAHGAPAHSGGLLPASAFWKTRALGKLLESLAMSVVFTWQGAVIAATVVAFPLMYRTARGAFEQLDSTLLYAARTLGMPEREVFWRVALPSAWPGRGGGRGARLCAGAGGIRGHGHVGGQHPGQDADNVAGHLFRRAGRGRR